MTMTNTEKQRKDAVELNAARIIVYQSTQCHPDWDELTHASYLESERMFDLTKEYLHCSWPRGPKLYPRSAFVKSWIAYPDRLAEFIRNQK